MMRMQRVYLPSKAYLGISLSLLILSSLASRAALTLTFANEGADLRMTASGDFSFEGTSLYTFTATASRVKGQSDSNVNPASSDSAYSVEGEVALGEFDAGAYFFTEDFELNSVISRTGDDFGIFARTNTVGIYTSPGFTNGGTIEGSALFPNINIVDLGVVEQTISLGASPLQDVIIDAGGLGVPEPSAPILIVLGCTAGFMRRRR